MLLGAGFLIFSILEDRRGEVYTQCELNNFSGRFLLGVLIHCSHERNYMDVSAIISCKDVEPTSQYQARIGLGVWEYRIDRASLVTLGG